jgi:Dolichyl-phosphate-mannose-protein mannosyltransferase
VTDRQGLDRRDILTATVLFAASTTLYALLGIRFDDSLLSSMQFIDKPLLVDRMLESIWYFHANPPLLNLFAGTGLKLFGRHAVWFYDVCFHILGFLVVLCVYALVRKLSASRIAAAITAGLLAFSPSFVLYENWLFYTFPAMALLTAAALALFELLETRKTSWCAGFFALLGTLLLTRSQFHLVWMLVIAASLVALCWERRRQILVAAALPLLIVTLWYGKNYYYFGSFAASTWLGLGLSNISTLVVPQRQLRPLVERHELTPWALVSRYDTRGLIFSGGLRPPTGIPVLDNVRRAVDGGYNFNYRDIPVIDRYYTADAITVMRRFPASYVLGVYMANRLYFSPTSMNLYFTDANRAAARPMETIFNPLLNGVSGRPGLMPRTNFGFAYDMLIEVHTSIPLIVVWCLVLGFGYGQARKAVLDPASRGNPRAIVMGFIVVTAAYLYLVSTTLELGENYRYRFVIEPLFFALAATAVTAAVRSVRQRKGAAGIQDAHREHLVCDPRHAGSPCPGAPE